MVHRQLPYSLTRFLDPKGKLSLIGSSRLLAAEIEVASIAPSSICRGGLSALDMTLNSWSCSVVSDGSLPAGGFEINTSPASGNKFIEQITAICATLLERRAKTDSRCGCHIHADARDCGYYEISKVLRLYAGIEPALFALVPASRRDNRYCCPCGARYLRAILERIDNRNGKEPAPSMSQPQHERAIPAPFYKEVKPDRNVTRSTILEALYGNKRVDTRRVRATKSSENRYRALNLHSWMYRGSLELRLPPGLVTAEDIIGWGTILASLVDHALATPVRTIMAAVAFILPPMAYLDRYNLTWRTITPKSLELLKSLSPNEGHKKWINHNARLHKEREA